MSTTTTHDILALRQNLWVNREVIGDMKVRFSKVWEDKNNFGEKVAPPPYGDEADGNYFRPHSAIPCGGTPQ